MYKKSLEDIRLTYKKLPLDVNEETIKIKVVLELLKVLNYNDDDFRYEVNTNKKCKDKRVDISIPIFNKEKDTFYVEVKRKNLELLEEDIRQIVSYLHDKHIEWGLLTNGNHYILINDKLDAPPSEKVVLEYFLVNIPTGISRTANKSVYEHLKLESIFINKTTNYFLLLKEFWLDSIKKSNISSSSKAQYYSACIMFINYLISTKKTYDINNFNIINFKDFIISTNDIKNNKYKKHSVISKYNYILKFVNFLESRNKINFNSFKNFDINDFIATLDLKSNTPLESSITNEEVQLILNYYNTQSNATRNKLLFLLILSGLEIDDILELKDDDIKFQSNHIKVKNKKYLLTKNMKPLFEELIKYKSANKIRCDYIFYRKYNGKYKNFGYTTLNDIINVTFSKLNLDNDRKQQLNIKSIKASLIRELYKTGYSLEEISYLLNLSIPSIITYLDEKDIMQKGLGSLKKVEKNHPYINFL